MTDQPIPYPSVCWHGNCYNGGATNLEGAHQRLINTHHRAGVVKLSAVVWCREQSYQLTLGKEFIAVFYHLSTTHTYRCAINFPTKKKQNSSKFWEFLRWFFQFSLKFSAAAKDNTKIIKYITKTISNIT